MADSKEDAVKIMEKQFSALQGNWWQILRVKCCQNFVELIVAAEKHLERGSKPHGVDSWCFNIALVEGKTKHCGLLSKTDF